MRWAKCPAVSKAVVTSWSLISGVSSCFKTLRQKSKNRKEKENEGGVTTRWNKNTWKQSVRMYIYIGIHQLVKESKMTT